MTRRCRLLYKRSAILFGSALVATCSFAQNHPAASHQDQELNRQFQAAVAQYDAGHLPEAAAQLEKLLQQVPDSFEAHELLGMVYAGESQDRACKTAPSRGRAPEAVVRGSPHEPRRQSDSHGRRGGGATATRKRREARSAELRCQSQSRRNLHQAGQTRGSNPVSQQAQQSKPSAYDNGYDLALAYLLHRACSAGASSGASSPEDAEYGGTAITSLAKLRRKKKNFVSAANESETAAHMEPSESNLFDWASELLLHRTLEPRSRCSGRVRSGIRNHPAWPLGWNRASFARQIRRGREVAAAQAPTSPSDPAAIFLIEGSRQFSAARGPGHTKFPAFSRIASRQCAGCVLRRDEHVERKARTGSEHQFSSRSRRCLQRRRRSI